LPNVLYLTNLAISAAIVVATRERLVLITDFRYLTTVARTRGQPFECPDMEMTSVQGSYDATLAAVLESGSMARVGFEAAHLTVARHGWLSGTLARAATPIDLVPTEGVVEAGRARKDAYELELLREGGRRISEVAREVLGEVRRGQSERDLALRIDSLIRQAGFERPAFDTIVASGPNAALPHARPSERKLRESDLVVLDFGGVYDSYCVDLTRTVSIGPASARARDVHAAVLSARDRAIAAAGPGRSRFDVDAAARDALRDAGMAEAFGHGTGHGLGLEVHEDPRIVERRPGVATAAETLEPGMVFTIEPGAYFPGFGGVRIEDDVVVTESGAELLTGVTTDLLEL
jgi:Xaa-Pro aminopeptidase